MPLIIHEFDTPDLLTQNLAKQIMTLLEQAIKAKGKASLVVSGGSTPKPLFTLLSQTDFAWEKVTVTLADERWVNATHQDSNEKLVRDNLLQGKVAAATFVSLTTEDQDAKMLNLRLVRE